MTLVDVVTRHGTDERAVRALMRDQIARLERRLADVPPGAHAPVTHGPRILDLADLERVRDDLAARVAARERADAARARAIARRRDLLTRMHTDPDAHRGVVVTAEELGETGCRRWKVCPVLGPVGRLAGWWRVRVSSGCPIAP